MKKLSDEDTENLWVYVQEFEETGAPASLEYMRRILRKHGYECGTIVTALKSAKRILGWD